MIDLVVGSDHRGYELKKAVHDYLVPIDKDIEKDITMFLDCGCYDGLKSVDYPEDLAYVKREIKKDIYLNKYKI